MIRAVQEGVTLAMRDNVEAMHKMVTVKNMRVVGAGVYKDYEDAVNTAVMVSQVIDPIPANYEAYDQAYQRFTMGYEALNQGGYYKGAYDMK